MDFKWQISVHNINYGIFEWPNTLYSPNISLFGHVQGCKRFFLDWWKYSDFHHFFEGPIGILKMTGAMQGIRQTMIHLTSFVICYIYFPTLSTQCKSDHTSLLRTQARGRSRKYFTSFIPIQVLHEVMVNQLTWLPVIKKKVLGLLRLIPT